MTMKRVKTYFYTHPAISLLIIFLFGAAVALSAQTEIRPMGSNVVVTGSIGLTTTAAPVSVTTVPVRELLVQCDSAATVDCYVGNLTTQVVHITPGQSFVIPITNLQLLYVKTLSGTATLNWIGRL